MRTPPATPAPAEDPPVALLCPECDKNSLTIRGLREEVRKLASGTEVRGVVVQVVCANCDTTFEPVAFVAGDGIGNALTIAPAGGGPDRAPVRALEG